VEFTTEAAHPQGVSAGGGEVVWTEAPLSGRAVVAELRDSLGEPGLAVPDAGSRTHRSVETARVTVVVDPNHVDPRGLALGRRRRR
jgi:hypothetical protein